MKTLNARCLMGLLAAVMLLGTACGGGGSAPAVSQPPAAPDLFVLETSGTTRQLVGMTVDGQSRRVLVPDATRLLAGSNLAFRSGDGLVYALKGAAYSYPQDIRRVALDGSSDKLLRHVDDPSTQIQLLGIRSGYLLALLRDSHYQGPLESVPLAGGSPVVTCAQAQEVWVGASSVLFGDASVSGAYTYRVAAVGSASSQPYLGGVAALTGLSSGGYLMGSYSGTPSTAITLLSADFAVQRELAPAGWALWPVALPGMEIGPLQGYQMDGGDRVFGVIPEGAGARLVAYSRSGSAPITLDTAPAPGGFFRQVGVASGRLVYQVGVPDPTSGITQITYRSVPAGGGTPVDLATAPEGDGLAIGFTATSLILAHWLPSGEGRLSVIHLEGAPAVNLTEALATDSGSGGLMAWVLGNRVAYVVHENGAYVLRSVDAQGGDLKTHLNSAATLWADNPNGEALKGGRICLARGSELLVFDPTRPAPVVLSTGGSRPNFAAWCAQRLVYQVQAGSSSVYALWSVRPDGSDSRKLSDNGNPFPVQ